MSESITIELPDEVLIEALRKLSPERRRHLLQQVNGESKVKVVLVPAASLQELTGIISVGGDALLESEHIYDE